MQQHQAFLFPNYTTSTPFRIIHYLGSKLRLLEPIKSAIEALVPTGGRICDLFSGSGSVSFGLRHAWAITAVDIQEYSRVLCSAVLNPPGQARELQAAILRRIQRSPLRATLRNALHSVIECERKALEAATTGDMDDLCELLDHGSLLLARECEQFPSSEESSIVVKLRQALSLLEREGLHEGNSTVATRHFGGIYSTVVLNQLLRRYGGGILLKGNPWFSFKDVSWPCLEAQGPV